MTNPVVKLVLVVATNWQTSSVTWPVCSQPYCLVYHQPTTNQIGIIATNTVAEVEFEGVTNRIILKSVLRNGGPVLSREVYAIQFQTPYSK